MVIKPTVNRIHEDTPHFSNKMTAQRLALMFLLCFAAETKAQKYQCNFPLGCVECCPIQDASAYEFDECQSICGKVKGAQMYQCDGPKGCVECVGGKCPLFPEVDGFYEFDECQSMCGAGYRAGAPPPPPPPEAQYPWYLCTAKGCELCDGVCPADATLYTLSECNSECTPPPGAPVFQCAPIGPDIPTLGRIPHSCVECVDGQCPIQDAHFYEFDECQAMCDVDPRAPPPRPPPEAQYLCTAKGCELCDGVCPIADAPVYSLSECNSECTPPPGAPVFQCAPTGPDIPTLGRIPHSCVECVDGQCPIQDAPFYEFGECQAMCDGGPPPPPPSVPMYQCDGPKGCIECTGRGQCPIQDAPVYEFDECQSMCGGGPEIPLHGNCTDDQLRAYDSNVISSKKDISLYIQCAEVFYPSEESLYCINCDVNGYDFEGCSGKLCRQKCEFDRKNPPSFAQHVSQMGVVHSSVVLTCRNGYNQTFCSYEVHCKEGNFDSNCRAVCEEPTFSACDVGKLENVASISMGGGTQCIDGYKPTDCARYVICNSETKEWILDYNVWGGTEKQTCLQLCEKLCSFDNLPNVIGMTAEGVPICADGYIISTNFYAESLFCTPNGMYEYNADLGGEPCVKTCPAYQIKEKYENVKEARLTDYGDLVVMCADGFMTDTSCLTCGEDAEWSHIDCVGKQVCAPQCKASDLNMTHIAGVDITQDEFGSNFVEISCEDDYILINHVSGGDVIVNCVECYGGEWRSSNYAKSKEQCKEICHKKCTLQDALTQAWAANVVSLTYNDYDSVEFTCLDGFIPSTNPCVPQCNSVGIWEGPDPAWCTDDTSTDVCIKSCSVKELQVDHLWS